MKKINVSRNLKWNLFFLSLFISPVFHSQTIWTVGPMVHVNFGGEKTRVSYGLEFAYWNFTHFPYSYDFGLEFQKKCTRLYSEIQTGIGLAGISAGPVLEFKTDKPMVKLGFQTSIWGNYFLGFDARLRIMGKKAFFCPGVYLKAGFDGKDENGNSTSSSSVYSSGHHHHHH